MAQLPADIAEWRAVKIRHDTASESGVFHTYLGHDDFSNNFRAA